MNALFGKELFIPFTVRVFFCERLSVCVYMFLSFLRVGCGIRLYRLLIIAHLLTLRKASAEVKFKDC